MVIQPTIGSGTSNTYIRKNIASKISGLKSAIASGDPTKDGFNEGDYFEGASGYNYILADYDHWYGGYNDHAITATRHWGVLVDTGTTHNWNSTDVVTGGYVASALHSYLTGTILPNVKSDMSKLGFSLISNSRLYTTAIDGWSWSSDQMIAAPTEAEIYGATVFSANGFQTGEGHHQLKVCQRFTIHELVGNKWFWLRSIYSSSNARLVSYSGAANYNLASRVDYVVGLVGIY